MHFSSLEFEMIRSELADVVGDEFVSISQVDKLVYATDWSWMPQMWIDRGQPPPSPDFIVHPANAQEISAVLKVANTYRIPVVPWGGILLDVKRLDQIVEISKTNLTATAQCGVNGAIFERALNEQNLTFPHYP